MTSTMKRGIIKVVLFYCLGIAIAVLTSLGPRHRHDAGLYPFAIMTLTVLIGFFWTLLTTYNFYFKEKSDERKGIIYTQLTVACMIVLAIFYLRSQTVFPKGETTAVPIPELKDDVISTSRSDTTKIVYGKTIILLRVKDSIIVDRTDSLYRTLKK